MGAVYRVQLPFGVPRSGGRSTLGAKGAKGVKTKLTSEWIVEKKSMTAPEVVPRVIARGEVTR